jgi:hypothetical protein
LASSLSRVQTPPPSYEAPLDVPAGNHPLAPPSDDNAGEFTTHANSPLNSSNEYERLITPRSSPLQAVAHSPVLEELHEHSPSSPVSELSETTESATISIRTTSPFSQSSPLVTSLPGSAPPNTILLPDIIVPTTPEDVTLSKPLSSGVVHITECPQNHHGCTMSTMKGDLSPVHKEVIIKVPDLTGKIAREGDYPAGRGGFADVWKCVLRSGLDECNVSCYICTQMTQNELFLGCS